MNEILEKENTEIKNLIYEIRGKQVMLDSDLAILYNCKNGTKEIKQAVKRNPVKFPKKYSWILTNEESKNFLVTKCDQKIETRGGRFKNPRVFTEQGVAMLATILKTPIAIKVSMQIIDAFVEMRHYLVDNKDIYKSLNNLNDRITNQENKLNKHDKKFDYLFSKFDKKEHLFLKGETFDAYFNILDIFNNAKNEIIVIDNYADVTFLDLIKNIKCNIVLITKDSNRLSDIEIDKYNKQYNNLRVIRNNSFHDRYFIIDKKDIYLSGSSLNGIGDKTSMIIKLEDKFIKEILLNNINEIMRKYQVKVNSFIQ